MSLRSYMKKNKFLLKGYIKCRNIQYAIATMISPKLNTAMHYKEVFGKKWDINNPITLNDWVLWLKFNTYWNNPVVKQCADKYRVREYIEKIKCSEILNDLIAVYEHIDDIEWDKLPNEFVIKLNVGCGYNIVVPDKTALDIEAEKKKLRKWMKEKYYLSHSEMQYKDVKQYIIVEKYLKPQKGVLPEDYKFYCYDGVVPYVMVCTERQAGSEPRFWYFNPQWEMQMLTKDALKYGKETVIEKPEGMDRAFEYARKLSKGFPFVRVDLYIVDGKIYFGEFTFTPSAGLDGGRLKQTDELLGKYVKI